MNDQRQPQTADRLLRLSEVLAATGMGHTYLYDLMGRGEFPRQIKIGQLSRWRESEVRKWQDNLTTGRSRSPHDSGKRKRRRAAPASN